MKAKTSTRVGGKGKGRGKLGARGSAKGGAKGRGRTGGRSRREGFALRKKFCRFCADKVNNVDYKDVKRLEYYIADRGKINSTRGSGNCAKHQRLVAEAIKKARFLSLLPYTR